MSVHNQFQVSEFSGVGSNLQVRGGGSFIPITKKKNLTYQINFQNHERNF